MPINVDDATNCDRRLVGELLYCVLKFQGDEAGNRGALMWKFGPVSDRVMATCQCGQGSLGGDSCCFVALRFRLFRADCLRGFGSSLLRFVWRTRNASHGCDADQQRRLQADVSDDASTRGHAQFLSHR